MMFGHSFVLGSVDVFGHSLVIDFSNVCAVLCAGPPGIHAQHEEPYR